MSLISRAKNILDVVSTLLVTTAAVALLWTLYKAPSATSLGAPSRVVETVTGLSIDRSKITKQLGSGNVALIEFSDFQCPYCAKHARETYPVIRRELIEQDTVTYISFAFPLDQIHREARRASEAAECAGRQGRFWEMHEWLFMNAHALATTDLSQRAGAIGLDTKRFEACMANEATAAVEADIEEGSRLNVNSTPTFFVGRVRPDGSIELLKRIQGAVPFETFAQAVAEVSKA
jgi:protein-disulfide isomerase